MKQLGPLHGDGADEQPAVAASHDAAVLGLGDAALDEIGGDGLEIIERPLAIPLERRLMPLRAEFAAAADIGKHIDAAAFEPGLADSRVVMREHGDLEAAVTVEH